MSELVPVPAGPPPSLLAPLTDPAGGSVFTRLRAFSGQTGVRRMLPWFVGVAALGGAALTWSAMTPSPQRTLYAQLDDGSRAGVVDALEKARIAYRIDRDTGALSVAESDYYRARMLVASNNALATPESGDQLLDSLPIGASRTLEGERLREAREHDLVLTIMQIDGVAGARVHLAEPEHSVFVRDESPPSASVMVRLSQGRHLSDGQVQAIVNLVASSVPGLAPDAVRVVDQSGQLLTDKSGHGDNDRIKLQAEMEDKLRGQVSALLTPMLGADNFSSQIQIDLDLDQVTSAHESYDKNGAVRSETDQTSQQAAQPGAAGVPGALSNTPPPAATPVNAPPQPGATASTAPPIASDSSSAKTYELGREVSVSNAAPGRIKRLTVAVAVSSAAKGASKPADVAQLQQLVSAAVGADPARGDQVAVVVRSFDPGPPEKTPFYEAAWFAPVLRAATALGTVLLVLLLAVRPLLKMIRPSARPKSLDEDEGAAPGAPVNVAAAMALPTIDPETGRADAAVLSRKVGIAQRLAADKPDRAASALRQMLAQPQSEMAGD